MLGSFDCLHGTDMVIELVEGCEPDEVSVYVTAYIKILIDN
jgi:hypothetical protein